MALWRYQLSHHVFAMSQENRATLPTIARLFLHFELFERGMRGLLGGAVALEVASWKLWWYRVKGGGVASTLSPVALLWAT